MKPTAFLLSALLAGISLSAAAGQDQFTIPCEKQVLSNGLNVILHVDRSDPIAAVYVLYHVGSAREQPGRTGFAHLFEHLRFNESQDIPQGQWFKKLQTAGASIINGSTSNDRTNYFEVVPKNALEMALWMESDRMGFLLGKFTQQTFVTQQNVVQNEKRQRENSPYAQTRYIMDSLMYPERHPYHWQVIGSLEDLANASLRDAIDFHQKYYGPSNATLVVAGDIDVPRTKAWIERYFAEIPSAAQPQPLPVQRVTLAQTRRACYEDALATAPQLTIAFPTAEDFSTDSYALEFLARILAGSKKSPLYQVLVAERKLAPAVSASQDSRELAGSFQLTVRAFPDTRLGEVEGAIKEAFARFEKDGFSERDVARQKAGLEYRFYSSLESVLGKSMRMADYNIYKGTPDFMATDRQNSLKVTKTDVQRVYDKYLKGKPCVITSIVPKGRTGLAAPDSTPFVVPEESIARQGAGKANAEEITPAPIPSKIDRTKEPVKGPDPVVTPPAIWNASASNGIPVFGIYCAELPIMEFSIILRGGMLLDAPSKTGTAYLTAKLMNEGTRTKSAVELKEAIDDLGASISISAGVQTTTLSASCLASKSREVFAIAKEILLEPRWDETEFSVLKSQTLEELKRSEKSPTAIASRVFDKLVYGTDNPLANQPNGTRESIGGITIDDLKQFYANNFSPTVAKVMVVGAMSKEASLEMLDGLKGWQPKQVVFPEITITHPAKPGLYFVDMPKAKQSVFSVGHLGPAFTDPDYYKTVVMNHKLGGDFSGILNMILREEKSFTYGARSGFTGSRYPGQFKVATQVQSNATFETCRIVRDQVAKYRDGIPQADLELVKSTLLKSNAGRFETLQQLGQLLGPVLEYNLPFDYASQREAIVRSMTAADLKALAQKYLKPDQLIYVIVGDKATQFGKLGELGLGDPVLVDQDGIRH